MPLLGDGGKCSCSPGRSPTYFLPHRNPTWGSLSRAKYWIISLSDHFLMCVWTSQLDPPQITRVGACWLQISSLLLLRISLHNCPRSSQSTEPLCFNHQWESAMGSSRAVVLLFSPIFPLLFFPKCCLSLDVTCSMMVFQSSNLLKLSETGCWSVFLRHFWQAVLS